MIPFPSYSTTLANNYLEKFKYIDGRNYFLTKNETSFLFKGGMSTEQRNMSLMVRGRCNFSLAA